MSLAVSVPTGLFKKTDGKALIIHWNDGAKSEFGFSELRSVCPCAVCVNEWTGERMLDPAGIPKDIHPLKIHSVGRYAMGIHWSDGHSTGIYSYDFLRKLDGKGENPVRG